MILIPAVVGLLYLGGWPLFGVVALFLTLGAVEFAQLMARRGHRLALVFSVALVWVFLLDAQLSLDLLWPGLAAVALGALAWQLAHRERWPVEEWALTLVSGLYLGLCGGHLLALRALPAGFWWLMTAFASVWIADSGAYMVGRRWGRHKMAPQLSPGKTWEGYFAGVVTGVLAGAGLSALWQLAAGAAPVPTPWQGALLGLMLAVLTPLGDLGISMIKREVGAKDSGRIIPGHGGALDRVDSLLWAAVLSYYLALWYVG